MTRVADFGPMIVETDVDAAVIKQMSTWFPTYLAQAERERGLNNRALVRPRAESFANTLDEDEFLDRMLPAIIVTTAQTVGTPERDGNGMYYAIWDVVISAVVRGRTPPETRGYAALYGGIVRRIVASMPSLGGFASESTWVSGNVAPVSDSTRRGRYLAAAMNRFAVAVDNVLQEGAGPLLPDPPENPYDPPDPTDPDPPYDPLAEVRDVQVSVTAIPIEQE